MFCKSLALGLLGSSVAYAVKEPILWSNSVHESCQHFTGHLVRQNIYESLSDRQNFCLTEKQSARFWKNHQGWRVCVYVCGGGYNKS